MQNEPIETDSKENKLGFINLAVLVLSLYVLGALLIDTFFTLEPEISRLLSLIDDFICVFFLFEFAIRLYRADNKLQFMKWGWIDLLSSIPTLEYFRPGRLFRLFKLFRILRAFRSLKHLSSHVFQKRIQGTFNSVVILAILMLIFSSVAILQVEDDPNSNIKTAEDALWWAYVTITTVGYGDKYPVTTEGRILAAFLMTTGVGLFGTFTGFVASWFVEGRIDERK
ncbi:MAG: ion transporter [Acidobacteriota bacterium]